MGCACSQQKLELENEFDQIWGNLKKLDLFNPQELKRHVNGKVYFQLLFSKFLFHFYSKIINNAQQLLRQDSDRTVKQLQEGIKQMQQQKERMKKRSEEIAGKYPYITSDLLTGKESIQREEEGREKKMNNRQSSKSTKSNRSYRSNREKQEIIRGSTIQEGEGIDCVEVTEKGSYEMPSSAIDQAQRKLEMSYMSVVEKEGIEKINETLEFQREKRSLHEDRIILLERQLEKVKRDCDRLNSDKKELQKREQTLNVNEKMKAQLQDLKNNSKRLTQNIQALSAQNERLQFKTIQLQSQLQSLKSNPNSFPNQISNPQTSPIADQQQNDIALRSFIILDPSQAAIEEDASQNIIRGCEIIFKLFTDSKLLPNHTLFQTAVGVRTIIGEMFGRPIRGSKLLYSYDKINPVSFGKYIENMNNLFAIFKLRNGSFVGGFAGKIDEGGYLQSSFLFSVRSQREPIKLPAKRKVPKVDREPGMMLFGAGELMVKIRSLELNCNIGNMQAFYGFQKKRNVSAEGFLGDSESPQPLEGYEIYQLQFHQVS